MDIKVWCDKTYQTFLLPIDIQEYIEIKFYYRGEGTWEIQLG